MVKKTKKTLSLNKELYKAIDHVAHLIAKITGKDIALIRSKSETEILQYLSYLLGEEKKEEKFLNWRNDKTLDQNLTPDTHDYQLIAKGIKNPKYKAYGTNKELHEFIKFLSARLVESGFHRAVNPNKSLNLSNPYASIAQTTPNPVTSSQISLNSVDLQNLLTRMTIVKANDNSPSRVI